MNKKHREFMVQVSCFIRSFLFFCKGTKYLRNMQVVGVVNWAYPDLFCHMWRKLFERGREAGGCRNFAV